MATESIFISGAASGGAERAQGLTEALSVEWRRRGVRVADVLPGSSTPQFLRTPRTFPRWTARR